MKNKVDIVRNVYLFGMSLIGVIFIIIGLIGISNSLVSIYFPQQAYESNLWAMNELYTSIVSAVCGLMVFIFHWYYIIKEKRLGRIENIQYESDMNFFEAIFFYLLAFLGIMVFLISIRGVVGGFYHIQYPPPEVDKAGNIIKESKPYITADVSEIVSSSVRSLIGIITFIIGFLRTHFSMHKVEKTSSF